MYSYTNLIAKVILTLYLKGGYCEELEPKAHTWAAIMATII